MTTLTLCLQRKSSRFCKKQTAYIGAAFQRDFGRRSESTARPGVVLAIGIFRLVLLRKSKKRSPIRKWRLHQSGARRDYDTAQGRTVS
jgi:hypothetical protein